jgi:hypothetical protein
MHDAAGGRVSLVVQVESEQKRSSISCSADRGKAYDPVADEK